ncbi:MAG: chloride channel protein [Endomicrobiia bacterium]|jgi:CIC family chloride channel protein|nr:chloride channel protein [Endomicrobiaceae bacterium]MDD3053001.1 chloride channel protein [Endomicrobiaceae bacterium]MDD3922931.1 chloride channel protein [Endomicrobiaceae bacterium]MDD5101710.1 chloride channel protein [Endomicrobiaceae bacterium]
MKTTILNKTKIFFQDISRSEIILQAIFVGVIAALLIVLFNLTITKIFALTQGFISHFTFIEKLFIFPIMTSVAGLIAGLLVFKIAPETKGSGIPFVKLTLARLGKRTRIRSIIVKFFGGAIGIGTGLSLGREGPSVQIGAGVGAFVAKIFKMKGTSQHNLIASGAASALGATFNAPISATIFALEELTQKFSAATLFSVLVATVSAVSVSRYFLGENPSFLVPLSSTSVHISPESFVIFIALGIAAGILGVLFAKTIFFDLKMYDKMQKIPNWAKPAIAGFIIGVLGLFLPYILGGGNLTIDQLLQHKFTIGWIALIFVGKFFVTPLCFSSGSVGGIFLPVLMLGSFLGYAIGMISNYFGIEVNLITISIVGMGTFLAAVARTPITAVVMVFEMTGDYHNILPVMFSVAIADLVAEKLNHAPIYSTLILKQDTPSKEKTILTKIMVTDAMDTSITKIGLDTKIKDVINLIKEEYYDVLPIMDKKGNLVGTISKDDLEDYTLRESNPNANIETIMNPEPIYINQEDDLYKALFILHSNGIKDIIVISRNKQIKGVLSRKQIMQKLRYSNLTK